MYKKNYLNKVALIFLVTFSSHAHSAGDVPISMNIALCLLLLVPFFSVAYILGRFKHMLSNILALSIALGPYILLINEYLVSKKIANHLIVNAFAVITLVLVLPVMLFFIARKKQLISVKKLAICNAWLIFHLILFICFAQNISEDYPLKFWLWFLLVLAPIIISNITFIKNKRI
jgi:hypothetical protein